MPVVIDEDDDISGESGSAIPVTVTDGTYGDIVVSGSGTQWDLAAGSVGTNELATGAVNTADIADDAVTYDKIAHIPGLSVPGNATSGTGPMTSITGVTVGHVLQVVAGPALGFAAASGGVSDGDKGDITVSSSGTVWNLDAGVVSTTELADGALSADATGRAKMADGFVDNAKIADDAVGYDELAHIAALSIPANATNATAAMTSLAFGTDHFVLARAGSVLTTKLVGTSNIADDAINCSKVGFDLGEFTATAANDFDIALPTGYQGDNIRGVDIMIRGTAASSAFFDILLNGTDTCDAFSHFLNDGGSFASGGTAPGVISATADNVVHIKMWTTTGLVRRVMVRSDGVYSGTRRSYFLEGSWADTSTVITSLRLRLAGGVNWTAGTKAQAWAW
jgi:hypothetical protein